MDSIYSALTRVHFSLASQQIKRVLIVGYKKTNGKCPFALKIP